MDRREFLGSGVVAGGLAFAGCLEHLGFEEQSAWEDQPLVEDRPDAVYLPAAQEEMDVYGTADDREYAVELSYTIPHRFWVVADDTERVDPSADDSLHLMCTVWDLETDTVLPVNIGLEIVEDGESVLERSPWPMISQRMGFHYGDNVSLPDDGNYTAVVRVGPLDVATMGAYEGQFESTSTLEIDFEYARSDIHDLGFELIDDDRRGTRDALPLMDHSDHGGDDSQGHGEHDTHPPASKGRSLEDLPAEVLVSERTADAALSVLEGSPPDAETDDEATAYLAVTLRTPYNEVVLPFASLTATVVRDGTELLTTRLEERLDDEYGHHYGHPVDEFESGDGVTIRVDSPPQLSRHDGYETAFFEFEDVSITY